ncbi:MAG: trypsin-like peptidase domain-containing protein [Bacteroidales bacterium]|jgi:Do/DeqQ family serine protease|nr:trypsin-like peptidase domain-containing protein [Bacteroidales bacterium]
MNKKTFLFGLTITVISITASLASVAIYTCATQNQQSQNRTQTNPDFRTVPTPRPMPSAGLPSFEDAAEYSINAVVHVKSEFLVKTGFYDEYFGFLNPFHGRSSTRRAEGFGSGVVISEDGFIITNNHVVQGAENIEITFNNRKVFSAKIVGTDPSTDLALLKVEARNLEYLSFGNSDLTRIGEWVLAVGNPFNLNSTVTAGIVSAKARNMNILSQNMSGNERPIESFIQTDAAVNRGNSGGALVNLQGELIGINTAIASTSGAFAGYSFAVPANIAKKVSEDLRTFGKVQRAYLGLLFAPMTQNIAQANNLEDIEGLFIARVVKDGAVDKAGLQVEDILLKIDGKSVNTEGDFFEIIGQLRPGETVELTYLKKGKTLRANIVLQDINGGTQKREVVSW